MALAQKYSEDAEFLHIFLSMTLQIPPSGCTFGYFSCQKVMKYRSVFRKKVIFFFSGVLAVETSNLPAETFAI